MRNQFKELKLVFAGNYREYIEYVNRHEKPDIKLIYVRGPEDFRGLEIKEIIKIGTYYLREDFNDLYQEAKLRIR